MLLFLSYLSSSYEQKDKGSENQVTGRKVKPVAGGIIIYILRSGFLSCLLHKKLGKAGGSL